YREEVIRPALMIPPASTSVEFVSLAQDAAQPLAYPLVERFVRRPVAVLEILHPAPQAAVDVFDDVLHRVGALAFGLSPECVLQFIQAFLAWPAVASLEVVAQKIEASRLTGVDSAGLGRMQGQPCLFHPFSYRRQCGLRLFGTGAEDDEVVCIAHHLPTLLGHQVV